VVKIYNDAMAEMQAVSGGRILPMALMPWWDVVESVKETERAQAMGLRGININSDPQSATINEGERLPDLSSPYWNPLWEICQDKNLPINFHIGASEQAIDFYNDAAWSGLDNEMRYVAGSTMLYFNNARVLANIILSGLLDRFERLSFVSVESGIGWVPFMLEALDYQYKEGSSGKALRMNPSAYFDRNCYATYWFENRHLSADVKRVGVERVMFETDFPHPTCLYPNPNYSDPIDGLSWSEQYALLCGNAAKVYNIELPGDEWNNAAARAGSSAS